MKGVALLMAVILTGVHFSYTMVWLSRAKAKSFWSFAYSFTRTSAIITIAGANDTIIITLSFFSENLKNLSQEIIPHIPQKAIDM